MSEDQHISKKVKIDDEISSNYCENQTSESSSDIIRVLPKLKKFNIEYPDRYSVSLIANAKKIMANNEILSNYLMWKNGINPKTKRTLIIGSTTHSKLENDYAYQIILDGYYHMETIMKLSKINIDEYQNKTKLLYTEINKKYQKYIDYNMKITELHKLIYDLKSWNDCVLYDGKKYGLPICINNIHKYMDCGGKITKNIIKRKYLVEKNGPDLFYYICNKCNMIYNKSGEISLVNAIIN